jgi:hypothetical protein
VVSWAKNELRIAEIFLACKKTGRVEIKGRLPVRTVLGSISQCANSIDESKSIYFFALSSSVVSCHSGQRYNRPFTPALRRATGAARKAA